MVIGTRPGVLPGTSLGSLMNGFVLTKQTEGKSSRTVEFYSENLKRFLWYAQKQDWPNDIRMITEWHIREFLGYLANEECRWGLKGNGSETSQGKASHTTVHHYFVVLANFFGWVAREGFLKESPTAKIKVAKPKVIKPYNHEEISCMLVVCDNDYGHNAKFLGSRNKAIDKDRAGQIPLVVWQEKDMRRWNKRQIQVTLTLCRKFTYGALALFSVHIRNPVQERTSIIDLSDNLSNREVYCRLAT